MVGMSELLSDQELTEALTHLPRWQRDGDSLTATAQLPTFVLAIAAVNRIAEIAESVDHHPDIDIRWRKLVFHLSTHSAGGLTAKDTSLAAEIDGVLDSYTE